MCNFRIRERYIEKVKIRDGPLIERLRCSPCLKRKTNSAHLNNVINYAIGTALQQIVTGLAHSDDAQGAVVTKAQESSPLLENPSMKMTLH